jgi:hypothetical protein
MSVAAAAPELSGRPKISLTEFMDRFRVRIRQRPSGEKGHLCVIKHRLDFLIGLVANADESLVNMDRERREIAALAWVLEKLMEQGNETTDVNQGGARCGGD